MSDEVNVKEVIMKCFGSCDSDVIKGKPLRAVYYVKGYPNDLRGLGEKIDRSYKNYIGSKITRIENFIYNQTNWDLLAGYADIKDVTTRYYTDEMYHMYNEKIAFNVMEHEVTCYPLIDVVVLDSMNDINAAYYEMGKIAEEFARHNVFFYIISKDNIYSYSRKDGKIMF